MRLLGITIKGVNGSTGLVNNTKSNSTMAELVYEWNVWETQTMVLLSFMLQVFLFGTGSLRRRKTNGVLKASIWLAYLGADFIAVYALGLFSQYEDKHNKLGRESFGDILPFLWVPFLLVHLGGQDSITAFSIEDNNLWMRHLLNLATQAVLALYVFWKSFHRINYSILILAMLVFVSGIIKYGERVWALKSASQNGIGELVRLKLHPGQNISYEEFVYPSKESYALQIVLLVRGLFSGRTVFQLGLSERHKLINVNIFEGCFRRYREEHEKHEMLVLELGMMFDLLYTKANVLQRWTGVLFRCASQTLMVVAFLLFLLMRIEKDAHKHNRVNVAITYILFTGAMAMEVYSTAVVMASPWTRAHLKPDSFLRRLCNFPTSFSEPTHHYRNKSMHQTSIGQFNLMNYCIAVTSKPKILSKTISAIGLDKQWRNLWYIHHIDDSSIVGKGIISSVMKIFVRGRDEWFRPRCLGWRLNYILSRRFEVALYALQTCTDLHITRHFAHINTAATLQLKEECETLSNYMIYLMMVHPSMLPISMASAENLESDVKIFESGLLEWVRINNNQHEGATKPDILEHMVTLLMGQTHCSLFDREPNAPIELEQSLKEMKEIWLRLLMYAAGKCRGELHARQLSEGGELITFVWLLMVHHGLGDVATELSLYEPDGGTLLPPSKPFFYAFNFHESPGGASAEQNEVRTTSKAATSMVKRVKRRRSYNMMTVAENEAGRVGSSVLECMVKHGAADS